MSRQQVAIILTAAIVLDGEIQKAGAELTLPFSEAQNLLARGRASLAEGEVLVDDQDPDEDQGDDALPPAPEAPKAKSRGGKEKK